MLHAGPDTDHADITRVYYTADVTHLKLTLVLHEVMIATGN